MDFPDLPVAALRLLLPAVVLAVGLLALVLGPGKTASGGGIAGASRKRGGGNPSSRRLHPALVVPVH
ncbi:hypothetical protein [Micromonospora sp. CA-244673]|uniref:hypothetical protein n=1 Tax=Micromonospora sp. CA-244673 TaxID=3239958 RepID=UPI003D939D51